MRPELVCKIQVQTSDRKRGRGTGYPITPNRIITAAHVVADAAVYKKGHAGPGAARRITLTFGSQETPVEGPVSLVWCDTNIDVAVLSCQLPLELQPAHTLLTTPPETHISWHAQGYTDFGKTKRPGGQDAYSGTLHKFEVNAATVYLSCTEGLVTAKKWAGGSGSVAFDSATSRTALAVITGYQGEKKLDQLVAVPLCYLLSNQATRDGFRQAIQYESYCKRQDHCQRVIDAIASRLKTLRLEGVRKVAEHIRADAHLNTQGMNLEDDNEDALAKRLATCFVTHSAVIDVVRSVMRLEKKLGTSHADTLSAIINYLLPLNYAPGVVHNLRTQGASQQQVRFVADTVATHTLAEVIMAGYDEQPAAFTVAGWGQPRLRGEPALDYYDGPEEALGVLDSELLLLRAARNVLSDLVLLQGSRYGRPSQHSNRQGGEAAGREALEQEIKESADLLRGLLNALRYRDQRTLYCVLAQSPIHERAVHRRVLDVIGHYLPELFFVELTPQPQVHNNAVEAEINEYIQGFYKTQQL